MAEDTLPVGYRSCDSQTLRAVRVRRLGSLPGGLALACSDIGEAVIRHDSGRETRALITWGRNIDPDEQYWYSTKTVFTPVWCGQDDGLAELVLEGDQDSEYYRWIMAGLAMTAAHIPWKEVGDGEE